MGLLRRVFFLAIGVFASSLIADDTPYLVRDFSGVTPKGSIGSQSQFWTTIGETTWFTAQGADGGVWKTDGTFAGTVRVAPVSGTFVGAINDRILYANSSGLFALPVNGNTPVLLTRDVTRTGQPAFLGDAIVFGCDGAKSLWQTDGTPAGTKQLDAGTYLFGSIGTAHVVTLNERIFFMGRSTLGSGLHRTDGTRAGTELLITVEPSRLNAGLSTLVVANSRIFASLGRIISDGTRAGSFGTNLPFASDEFLGEIGGKVYFGGTTLWETDGTTVARSALVPSVTQARYYRGGRVGDRILFFQWLPNGTATLFATDGITATEILETRSYNNFFGGIVSGNRFFFAHNDGVHGYEPWVTDGTREGTHLIADVNPGPASGFVQAIGLPTSRGVIFAAEGMNRGVEPWFTDGTETRTWMIANVATDDPLHGSSPHMLRSDGQKLFFLATVDGRLSAATSNGTSFGTFVMNATSSVAIDAAAAGNRYFTRSSNGTITAIEPSGRTVVIPAIASGPLVPLRDGVLFPSSDEVWFSNGNGTRALPRVAAEDPRPTRIFVIGDVVWLAKGPRIWRSDGSTIVDEVPQSGNRHGNIGTIERIGDAYWFVEEWNGVNEFGPQLWRSSASTPTLLQRIRGFEPTVQMTQPVLLGGSSKATLFTFGTEFYRSDGTAAGTYGLPMSIDVCDRGALTLGETIVFAGFDAARESALWRSDGTTAGTSRLLQGDGTCPEMAVLNGSIYFRGYDSAHGWEPWVSDGTVAGTRMLADLSPGQLSSDPQEFTVAGTRVFFSATTPNHDRELWAIGFEPPSRRPSVRH